MTIRRRNRPNPLMIHMKDRRQLTDEQMKLEQQRIRHLASKQAKLYMDSPDMREKIQAVIEKLNRNSHG